jgi:hypothetical protein
MKNRPWYCYTLDALGIVTLAAAAAALAVALWLSGAAAEALALALFKYTLTGSVTAFLAARSCEIVLALQRGAPQPAAPGAEPSNVEELPRHDDLPRAA